MVETEIKLKITVCDRERLTEEQAIGALLHGLRDINYTPYVEKIQSDSKTVFTREDLKKEHPTLFPMKKAS